ncbi:hypothetical protein KC19_VG285900 [Ceratodon purpureus]|uniref:Uncharacterized protein n=1 Tax=Ceratodon purpureus TaxID=3225 RepID=A0A8T0HWD2_CERPU|nr:hypothetical protein KC19_VG285900 [Ceratodon purpureus]
MRRCMVSTKHWSSTYSNTRRSPTPTSISTTNFAQPPPTLTTVCGARGPSMQRSWMGHFLRLLIEVTKATVLVVGHPHCLENSLHTVQRLGSSVQLRESGTRIRIQGLGRVGGTKKWRLEGNFTAREK